MNEKRRIVYVITKSNWGGAQRYVYDLATHLPAREFDVLVACGGSGKLTEALMRAGVRVALIPALERDIHLAKELFAFFSLLRLFMRERPAIVHLNSSKIGGLGAVAARLASFFTRKRALVVFTVHGWGFKENRPRWQRASIFALSWLSSLFQDVVIAVDAEDQRLATRFVPEKKLRLIPHGLAPTMLASREEARTLLIERANSPIHAETNPPTFPRGIGPRGKDLEPPFIPAAEPRGIREGGEINFIGVIAELTKNKGLRYLVEAISQIRSKTRNPNFKVIIMGEGEERGALQAQISELKLEETIFLLGFMPDAARLLRGLDVFCLPSLKEGLPYAIMEAMAAGLPIVASRVGGIPDLVTSGENGLLVDSKDPHALAQALESLIRKPEMGQSFGRRSVEKIHKHFTIEAMLAGTVAVYRTARE